MAKQRNSAKYRKKSLKRGGENTSGLDIETGTMAKPTPLLYDPNKIGNIDKLPTFSVQPTSKQEVEDVFSRKTKRDSAIDEFNKLNERYKAVQQHSQEINDVQKSFETPVSHEELEAFFASNPHDNSPKTQNKCEGPGCVVSGGKKSRKRKCKSHKCKC
jgi:hypothetical protein